MYKFKHHQSSIFAGEREAREGKKDRRKLLPCFIRRRYCNCHLCCCSEMNSKREKTTGLLFAFPCGEWYRCISEQRVSQCLTLHPMMKAVAHKHTHTLMKTYCTPGMILISLVSSCSPQLLTTGISMVPK